VKLSQRRGRLRLQLEPIENQVLGNLLGELSAVVLEDEADDPVVRRLFPAAYPDDADADTEFRSMTETSLRDERVERIDACVAELDSGQDIDLADPDTATRWIQTINDVRLSIGTRLGITEDEPDLDPDDEDAQPKLVYYWLTGLQDSVVTALMDHR
jgi:hypothetical protein